MKLLVFSAHPDDAILGAGGTILNHLKRKDRVKIANFSYAICKKSEINSVKKDRIEMVQVTELHGEIDLSTSIIFKSMNIIREFKPDRILTHLPGGHLDHLKTSIITRRAAELAGNSKIQSSCQPHQAEKVYFFETVEGTLSSSDTVNSMAYVDITESFKKKIGILKRFKSILKYVPELLELTEALARLRGFESQSRYAEAFLCCPILQKAEEFGGIFTDNELNRYFITDFERISSTTLP